MLYMLKAVLVLSIRSDHIWQSAEACLRGVWLLLAGFFAPLPVQVHALSPHPLVWECPAPVLLHVCKTLASQGFISHLRVM